MQYFVGTHLAELLNRESFNLYGSLRRRRIAMRRADARVKNLLVSRGVIHPGSISVTLVNAEEVSGFVDYCLENNEQRKKRRKGEEVHESEMAERHEDVEAGHLPVPQDHAFELLINFCQSVHASTLP